MFRFKFSYKKFTNFHPPLGAKGDNLQTHPWLYGAGLPSIMMSNLEADSFIKKDYQIMATGARHQTHRQLEVGEHRAPQKETGFVNWSQWANINTSHNKKTQEYNTSCFLILCNKG